MSDNITREPYRNAWYKQLQEEISKVTPHLVPEVENDDNGKILVAGQEGTFDWAQPPEELPVITESDEGKVLKVDEGVPKWLEDIDNEYLLVTITRSGTSPNYTYTADKTYDEIRPFAQNGKVVVLYDNLIHSLYQLTPTSIVFKLIRYYYIGNDFTLKRDSVQSKYIIYTATFTVDNLTYEQVDSYNIIGVSVKNNTALSAATKELLFRALASGLNSVNVYTKVSNLYTYYHLDEFNQNNNAAVLYNASKTKRVDINFTSGLVTITDVQSLPTPTSADEGKVLMIDANGDYTLGTVQGGSPHYAEVSLGISVE